MDNMVQILVGLIETQLSVGILEIQISVGIIELRLLIGVMEFHISVPWQHQHRKAEHRQHDPNSTFWSASMSS
jgi:hypothetical protein